MVKHRVIVQFGPYMSYGLLDHRTERLEGLQALLKADGHTVDFVKTPDRNAVELEVHGESSLPAKFKTCNLGRWSVGS